MFTRVEKISQVGNNMATLRSRKGITLIELMVTIAIMGFLVTVALPNIFGVAEKTREKVDLLKLYYLRDALNRALIEDLEAFNNYTPTEKGNKPDKIKMEGLSKPSGASLFVIELHNGLTINVQGEHGSANNNYNICRAIGTSGTFYEALKEARFEGVADIIADRLNDNNFNFNSSTYTAIPYEYSENKIDYRTAPKQPLFISKALNVGKYAANTRYTMNIRWSDSNPGFAVEVFILPHGKDYQSAYRTDNGVCFSTLGRKGCKNSN